MRVPLAGGTQETLLSEVGPVLLRFVSTRDACALRLVCREFLAAVTEHPWEDRRTAIRGSIRAWRACFPHARCANVQQNVYGYPTCGEWRVAPVVDADFVHFEGLQELYMAGCRGVTDAAFVHLRGIRTLDMTACDQRAISNAAFEHLAGIQRLSMWSCRQATITDDALAHLRGVQVLNVSACDQLTGAAFAHLQGIHTLYMWTCDQRAITDAAMAHLKGIHTLVIESCRQFQGAGLAHLKGIHALGMYRCLVDQVAAARSLGLRVYELDSTSYGGLHYTFDAR